MAGLAAQLVSLAAGQYLIPRANLKLASVTEINMSCPFSYFPTSDLISRGFYISLFLQPSQGMLIIYGEELNLDRNSLSFSHEP